MAFDLVQYFVEQIETQKPELLGEFSKTERRLKIEKLNALTLGKLISEWRADPKKTYAEIVTPDELYAIEIARNLAVSKTNQSAINRTELEEIIFKIFQFQLLELKQLHDTGNHNQSSIQELLNGQIEHLAGQAEDWVWTTNNLTELKGSKPTPQEEISLEASMKEFSQMVSQNTQHDHHEQEVAVISTPTWAKIVEPVVALVILWVLASALCKVFA